MWLVAGPEVPLGKQGGDAGRGTTMLPSAPAGKF